MKLRFPRKWHTGALVAFLVLSVARGFAQAVPATTTPKASDTNGTATVGQDRMEDSFSLVPDLPAVTKIPDLTGLPDPLKMIDGTKVTTPAQWEKRRQEMKRIIAFYQFGRMPPPPGNVRGEELKSEFVLGGAVKYRLVHLSFGPDGRLGFDIALFTPVAGNAPHPTIVNPSFAATPGAAPRERHHQN